MILVGTSVWIDHPRHGNETLDSLLTQHRVCIHPMVTGELVVHVFGAIAHFERSLIVERTLDGIAAARKRGRHPGRPRHSQETMSAVKKLLGAGMSPGEAAKLVGIGRTSAYRIARELHES